MGYYDYKAYQDCKKKEEYRKQHPNEKEPTGCFEGIFIIGALIIAFCWMAYSFFNGIGIFITQLFS